MAKLPALPPSPLWLGKQVPPKFRPFAFLPLLLVYAFLVFGLVGIIAQEFEWALLAGLLAGPALAYGSVGLPITKAQVEKGLAKVPRPPPDKRPFLFFPAALVAAAVLYFAIGFTLTSAPLDEDLLALLALGVAIPAAIVLGYLAFGFPKPKGPLRDMKSPLHRIPEEKRPLLFVPLGLLFAAPLYFLLGYAFTEVLEPDIAVLLGLALGLAIGFLLAYRLVGIPRTTMVQQGLDRLPKVPAKARPAAFVAFVLLVGALFAIVLGGVVASFDSVDLLVSEAALDLAFPLFLLAGWLLAVPLAGRLFGYPIPDRPLHEYVPRLTAEERPAALLPLTLVLGLVFTFLAGMLLGLVPLADLEDAALGAAIGFPLALLLSLRILRIPLRRVDPRGLEHVPEQAKPLVAFALALFLGTVLFALLGQVPFLGFVEAFLAAYAVGLAVAVLLVDHPALGARASRKAQAKAIEARLRQEMGLADEAEAQASGLGSRLRLRRGKA
jgi:hypothetical protein